MKKILMICAFVLSISNASDGYVQLSTLDYNDLKDNNFVAVNEAKENSKWVNLSEVNDKEDLNKLAMNFEIEDSDEYISMSVYDTEMMLEPTNTQYVALEKLNKVEDYDILAIYDEMMKEEKEEFLSMNFDF